MIYGYLMILVLKKYFNNAYRNNQTETIEIIEKLESKFQCCGVNSSSDYTKSWLSKSHYLVINIINHWSSF